MLFVSLLALLFACRRTPGSGSSIHKPPLKDARSGDLFRFDKSVRFQRMIDLAFAQGLAVRLSSFG